MNRNFETYVTFKYPFALSGYKDTLPAGTYRMEVEEERIEDLSFTAFRRKQVTLHLHADPKQPGISEMLTLAPHEIDAAVVWDRRSGPDVDHSQPRSRFFSAPARPSAGEHGKDEGMLWVSPDDATPGHKNRMFLDDEFD